MTIAKLINFAWMFLFCFLISYPAKADQTELFNGFTAHSWKSQNVHIGGHDGTIEQHLVRIFSEAGWIHALNKKITPIDALDDIITHFNSALNPDLNPPNPEGWEADLHKNDSPRTWADNLDLREIYRFKNFILANPDLIRDAHHATDDLVKARSLAGTFWRVPIIPPGAQARPAVPIFSGMLTQGQAFGGPYQVDTCIHGFLDGNMTNNMTYYFVPYGVVVSGVFDPDLGIDDPNYIRNKGFKVTHVRRFRDADPPAGTNLNINDAFFNKDSPDLTEDVLYREKDYAVATIEGATRTGILLKDVLMGTGLGIVQAAHVRLPSINTALPADADPDALLPVDLNVVLGADERLFAIGMASFPDMSLSHGLIVSTNMRNDGIAAAPRRSFRDDENQPEPDLINSRNEEASSSVSVYYGTSGGPILRCRLDHGDGSNKKCAVIGTIHGSERVFDAGNNFIGFKNFINKLLPLP